MEALTSDAILHLTPAERLSLILARCQEQARQVFHNFIHGLQFPAHHIALAKARAVVTANSREASNLRLYQRPILGGPPTTRDQENRLRTCGIVQWVME